MMRLIAALSLAASTAFASPVIEARPVATQTIVLAGGCFWGVQSVFEHTKGVANAVSGFAGGWADKPSYELVSSGRSGHAESVHVTFDPAQISLDQLLQIFFTVAHDPTQRNRQGPDVGTQYRSMVLYANDEQKAAAKAFIDRLDRERTYGGRPIVTEVVPLKTFFEAEAYHQHYAERHPKDPYIVYNDAPKIAALKQRYPQLYRDVQ